MVTLNAQVLQDLAELSQNGNKFVVTLIEKFFKTAPVQIQKMKNEIQSSDFIALKKTVHYFKSSAGNIGAMKMSELCGVIQNLNDNEPAEVYKANLELIEQEWMKLERELKLELLTLGSG